MDKTVNILSFDIEDWFHPEIFSGRYPMTSWDSLESRVEAETDLILSFLERKNLKATFFFLGWVAEKFPHLVKKAVKGGHEIASHGYSHRMITQMTPEEFRLDLRKSIDILRSLSPDPVLGFRAPTFSVTDETRWALPIMYDEGIRYDSSVFPIRHDRYGIPDSPREPYWILDDGERKLREYPMTTVRFGSFNLPLGGGGYFRIFPYTFTRKLMEKCQAEKRAVMFYAHPWEFDTELPRVSLGTVGTWRHYTKIERVMQRLDRLTDLFEFTSFRDAYQTSTTLKTEPVA